jgi:hypothetical protein
MRFGVGLDICWTECVRYGRAELGRYIRDRDTLV